MASRYHHCYQQPVSARLLPKHRRSVFLFFSLVCKASFAASPSLYTYTQECGTSLVPFSHFFFVRKGLPQVSPATRTTFTHSVHLRCHGNIIGSHSQPSRHQQIKWRHYHISSESRPSLSSPCIISHLLVESRSPHPVTYTNLEQYHNRVSY